MIFEAADVLWNGIWNLQALRCQGHQLEIIKLARQQYVHCTLMSTGIAHSKSQVSWPVSGEW